MSGVFGAGQLAFVVVLQWFSGNTVYAEGIYTCVDKYGRSYLSDKRIPECLDVVQNELGKSGIVKRRIEPETNLSAAGTKGEGLVAVDAAKEKALREARQQKALLDRYPDEATHIYERKRALLPVEESIKSIRTQTDQHLLQRQSLLQEQAGYKIKMLTVPSELQQSINETEALLVLLDRQLSERMHERQRINQRFDAEVSQLRSKWNRESAVKTK